MTFLNTTLDTQRVSPHDLKRLLRDGQTLHAVGILNRRWEDFSALELAQDAGLTEVTWDTVFDDTPGTLELTVWYPQLEAEALRQRVDTMHGIEQYEVQGQS